MLVAASVSPDYFFGAERRPAAGRQPSAIHTDHGLMPVSRIDVYGLHRVLHRFGSRLVEALGEGGTDPPWPASCSSTSGGRASAWRAVSEKRQFR